MGAQLMQMAYNLVDTIWLGRLGDGAVAASGTAGMFTWLAVSLMLIGSIGATIGVSQNLGKGDEKKALLFSQNAFWVALALGLGFGIILAVFRYPLVGFFNITDPIVESDTRLYLMIIAIGIPFLYGSASISATFTASGRSQLSFAVSVTGMVLNVVLDPLCIFVFGWGITGAAIATIFAQFVSFTIGLAIIRFWRNRPFDRYRFLVRPSLPEIKQIFRWGFPLCVESGLFTILAMFTSRFEAAYGTRAMAVGRIGSQIESITWMVGGGFGSALLAFIGQNFGAGKWTRIRRGVKLSTLFMICYGLAVSTIMLVFGKYLFLVFRNDVDTAALGVIYLRNMAICQVFMCIEGVASSVFKGIGKTLPPAVTSATANVIRVFLAYGLSLTPLGLHGIWLGIALASSLKGIALYTWHMISARKYPREDVKTVEPIPLAEAVE